MKRKVAFVIQRYGQEVNGGAESYAQQVAEKLSGQFDIDVLTTCALDHVTWKNHFKPGVSTLNGITLHRFPTDAERGFNEFERLQQQLARSSFHADRIRHEVEYIYAQGPVSLALTDHIRTNRDRYDVFVFLGFIFYPTAAGLQLVPEKSILVPFAHDEPITYFKFMKQLFSLPRKILFCTPEERSLVQRVSRNQHVPSEVAGLGFDPPNVADLPDFRTETPVINPFILYVGRIEEGKGCKEMIDHFCAYKANHPGQALDLVLIGKTAMAIPKREDIHYLGFVDEPLKHAAMKAAMALIVPSRYESLSMVFMEALLCGTPPIVNARSEVLRGHCLRGNCGLYYENEAEFAACIDWFATHDTRPLVENGRQYVAENYNWEKITGHFRSAILDI